MSDTETPQSHQTESTDPTPQDPNPLNDAAKFTIWPPSQRTRDAVTTRLINTLSTPSILSNRYGTVAPDEASAIARRIEEEAYGAASAGGSSGDDGIEVLKVYSNEISKRMIEAVKGKAKAKDGDAKAEAEAAGSAEGGDDAAAVAASEDVDN